MVFPEKRQQVVAERWAELTGYLDYWQRGVGLEDGLLGLRLISPEQFASLGISARPAVAHIQQRVAHEMEWLRRNPAASRTRLARYMVTAALLSADQIEFNPQGGLVLGRPSHLSQERPLPERSGV